MVGPVATLKAVCASAACQAVIFGATKQTVRRRSACQRIRACLARQLVGGRRDACVDGVGKLGARNRLDLRKAAGGITNAVVVIGSRLIRRKGGRDANGAKEDVERQKVKISGIFATCDGIVLMVFGDNERVVAKAAKNVVSANGTRQRVIAVIAVNLIIGGTAVNQIVANTTIKRVIAAIG